MQTTFFGLDDSFFGQFLKRLSSNQVQFSPVPFILPYIPFLYIRYCIFFSNLQFIDYNVLAVGHSQIKAWSKPLNWYLQWIPFSWFVKAFNQNFQNIEIKEGRKLLIVSNHPVRFDGRRYCGSWYKMFLIYHMTSRYHVLKGLCGLMG